MIDADKRDAVENWLTKEVDNKAAPVIRKILSDGIHSINSEEVSFVIRFVMSLIVRRPENIDRLNQEAPMELARNMAKQDEEIQRELRDAGVTDTITLLEYAQKNRPGWVENFGNLMISPIVGDQRRADWLIRRKWWTVDYEGTSVIPQITSDRGVTCLGVALDDPNSMVILPLSPLRVLYITSDEGKQRLQALGKGRLGLNTIKVVAANARTFVLGTRKTNRNLVERHLARPVT